MSDRDKMICVLVIIALLAGVTFYFAVDNSPGPNAPIPAIQTEAQVGSLGQRAGLLIGASGPDIGYAGRINLQEHFWAPGFGYNYVNSPDDTPVTVTPHRYPVVPGGNISTVMHHGIVEACVNRAPADNDWRLNPPETAVL